MLSYPDIDPVAISIGPFDVHWYGLMYLFGFAIAWWLGRHRARLPHTPLDERQFGDLLFFCVIGLIVGARVGYVLFYDFAGLLQNPFTIFALWQGGMSFHGGLIGVLLAMFYLSRREGISFWDIGDFSVPLAPLGLALGRLGNFINGELWGRVTEVPWGMVFPTGGPDPRHPSQLYQAALEGVLLFLILWWFSSKPRPRMATAGLFLLGYGVFRSFAEFFREPDAHIGYLAFGWLTMGQLLTVPMIIAGSTMLVLAYRGATGGKEKQA